LKTKFIAIAAILGFLTLTVPAHAHGRGNDFGSFGLFGGLGFDGLGFGDHFGGFGRFNFGDFGWLGLGLGSSSADRLQTRFTDQFDALKTQYDNGVANNTDFFTTDTYDRIVNKTQRLDDRYMTFVDAVQSTIDRIPDLVSLTNDNIDFYNNLLADYQADTSIPSAKLDRIELVINHITDRLNSRIESLNNTESTLQANLSTYQTTESDISKFLSDIQAAGGGTSGVSTSPSLVSLTNTLKSAQAETANVITSSEISTSDLTPSSVPEPSSLLLLLSGVGAFSVLATRRRPRVG